MEQSSWFPFSDFDFSFTEKSKRRSLVRILRVSLKGMRTAWKKYNRERRAERCEWSVPDFKGRERKSQTRKRFYSCVVMFLRHVCYRLLYTERDTHSMLLASVSSPYFLYKNLRKYLIANQKIQTHLNI